MKRLLFVLWLALSFTGYAQTGNYFLSHYKPGDDNINYTSYDIDEDVNGVLYFASRNGVLLYDGRTWGQVDTKGAAYTLAVAPNGDVFAGGTRGFGRLQRDERNVLVFALLSDSLPGASNCFASAIKGDRVYFMTEKQVFEYDLKTAKSRKAAIADIDDSFHGLFRIDDEVYLLSEKSGLEQIGETLKPVQFPELGTSSITLSQPSADGKSFFVVTGNDRLFLRRNSQWIEVKPAQIDYLSTNVIANVSWVTDNLVAIGTLRGGVAFLDVDKGEITETSSYLTGLPDNDVYALHTDRHQGVWVAHDYGFTRIAPFLPFRTFNHYPGLVGNLLCVQSFGDLVYVGTSLGLFALVKEDIFEDQTYQVTQSETITTEEIKQEIQDEIRQTHKKTKFGFLSLKKKKKTEEEPEAKPKTQVVTLQPATTKTITRQVQRKRKVLVGTEYKFKPVEGISGRVDQMVLASDRLLCGGIGGVFQVSGLTSFPVTRDPARSVYYAKNLKQLLVGTYDDEIAAFGMNKQGWDVADFPDSLSVYADYFFEDNLQNLWICSRDHVIKVGTDENQIVESARFPLPEAAVDKTVGLAFGSEVYLAQNGQFFQYASFKNGFTRYDSLPSPKKYFASGGSFWFFDGHRWRTVDKRLQGTIKTEWLGIFADLRFLSPAEQGKSLWVITSSNELYKFAGDMAQPPGQTNPLFLKEIRSQESRLPLSARMQVDELQSALTFEFVQPEFVSLQAVEYRYRVVGLQDTWSDWSTLNNVVNFPFLPPGKYSVEVESKNLFGNITKLKPIDFRVVPPYWQRPWFYALEFFFFGALVVLSLRLNVAQMKYRYLSRFLSALTIIMLIQFIQTVITANLNFKSTPVADFFVNVTIALLVLPVEEFMRKKMVQADKKIH